MFADLDRSHRDFLCAPTVLAHQFIGQTEPDHTSCEGEVARSYPHNNKEIARGSEVGRGLFAEQEVEANVTSVHPHMFSAWGTFSFQGN